MPYSSVNELPKAVRDKIKDPKKRRQWMHVFNSMIAEGRSESAAMAGAWSVVGKAQHSADVFTTAEEARSRSMDMGLGGAIHVEDYNEQAVYLPGETEDDYLNYYRNLAGIPPEMEEEDGTTVSIEITFKNEVEGKILKADDEQRLVYGWASVITEKGERVVDRQGDVIEAETLVKAVNDFMEHVRVGKAMHTGEQVGVVIHSLPITKEIGDALGIHSDREGWVVAYKVYDDVVWNMVKSGELAAFSIGGRAMKQEIE
jgi:cation transport regulator ChaB